MKGPVDFESLQVGDALPPVRAGTITKLQLVRYAGASGDFNPLHTDDEVARKAGLEGVIAQGMLIMGMVGKAIGMWGGRKPLRRFKVRFLGMTFPGDVITVSAVLKLKSEGAEGRRILCETAARDQNGTAKVSGEFELIIQAKGGKTL